MSEPLDMGFSSDGRIYVREVIGHEVTVLNAEGRFIGSWGGEGGQQGTFNFRNANGTSVKLLGGILIENDVVYIADKLRLQRFDLDGRFLGTVGGDAQPPAGLKMPQQMAIGPDGNIYITDTQLMTVQVLSKEGVLIRRWQIPPSNKRHFPAHMCVNNLGDVFVADERSDASEDRPGVIIFKYSSQGKLLRTWGARDNNNGQFEEGEFPGGTSGVACSNDGRLYISDLAARRIQVFDFDGNFLFALQAPDGREFDGVAVTDDGHLFVTDGSTGTLSKYRIEA